MKQTPINQDQTKKAYDIRSDMKSNGDFIMIPKGLREMGIRGLHLEIYIKLLESNSRFITQQNIADELEIGIATVKRAYKQFKDLGMMKGKKLSPRKDWIETKGIMDDTKRYHGRYQKVSSVIPTIKENKTPENISEHIHNDASLDVLVKEKNIEIKKSQVSQCNTSDTAYDKYSNNYCKAVAEHVCKGHKQIRKRFSGSEDEIKKQVWELTREIHGPNPTCGRNMRLYPWYKDHALDESIPDSFFECLDRWSMAVKNGYRRLDRADLRGKYVIFNKRFIDEVMREVYD